MDNLPQGLTFEHYEATNGVYNYTTGIWSIDVLKPHEIATLIITTKIGNIKGKITNVAVLGIMNDNDTVEVDNEVKLDIVKTVSDENPKYGDEINWTITVTNHGPIIAKDVTVTDILPEGLIYVKSNREYNNGVWNIGDILQGESRSLIITTRVNDYSIITNTAFVNTSSNNTGNNTSKKSINVTYDENEENKTDNSTTNIPDINNEKNETIDIPHENTLNKSIETESKKYSNSENINFDKNETSNPIMLLLATIGFISIKTFRRRK